MSDMATETPAPHRPPPRGFQDVQEPFGRAALDRLAGRDPRIARALEELAIAGQLTGAQSERISVRVDPGVVTAAAARLGLDRGNISELVNAALALAAAPDRFKAWLRDTPDTLPDDFEAGA